MPTIAHVGEIETISASSAATSSFVPAHRRCTGGVAGHEPQEGQLGFAARLAAAARVERARGPAHGCASGTASSSGSSRVMRPASSSTIRSTRPGGRSRSCETITSAMSLRRRRPREQRVELGAPVGVEARERLVEHDRARVARRARPRARRAASARRSTRRRAGSANAMRVEADRRERGAARASSSTPPAARTSSSTVGRSSCRRACWNDRPTRPTCSAIGSAVEQRRALARRRGDPARIHASVDLPEPLCPTTTIASPAWTVRSTSVSARFAHGVPRE